MVDINLTFWGFVGTWVLVVGTIALMWWQTRQSWILNSANAVMTLRERFNDPTMRRARRELATCLLEHEHEDVTNLEVAAFFELIGALTHREVLEDDLVWEAFGTWIADYYWALRHPVDQIGQARAALKDPLLFHEFEWLTARILEIDRRELGPSRAVAVEGEAEIRAFLQRESELDQPN